MEILKISLKLRKTSSNILKILAILMVIISHWYRYVDVGSQFAVLKSIGVFGASLFAFLTGYGLERSYIENKIYERWLELHITRVYIPFVIVNALSALLIYEDMGITFITETLTGFEDGVMWYVPFVIGFYIIFFLSDKFFKGYRFQFIFIASIL